MESEDARAGAASLHPLALTAPAPGATPAPARAPHSMKLNPTYRWFLPLPSRPIVNGHIPYASQSLSMLSAPWLPLPAAPDTPSPFIGKQRAPYSSFVYPGRATVTPLPPLALPLLPPPPACWSHLVRNLLARLKLRKKSSASPSPPLAFARSRAPRQRRPTNSHERYQPESS